MSTRTRKLETELFGRETDFEYSEHWVGYALVGLRVVMGWVLLQGGLTKLVTYLDGNPETNWTAAGYLGNAIPAGNPFGFWDAMASAPLVDPLVIWGQILIGLALLVGVAVRFAAFCGALQMILFWMSHLEGGIMAGFPIEHGWFVSSHIVYALLLFGLGAIGAGRILGVDSYLEDLEFVQANPWLKYLLG
mgnify:CR=1 FL=1